MADLHRSLRRKIRLRDILLMPVIHTGTRATLCYRISRICSQIRVLRAVGGLIRLFALLTTGAEISSHARIAPGLHLPHPNGVINYLSRYVRGGPFKNQQIKRVTSDVVEFHYFDHREKKQSSSNFTPDSFVASALEHVPPHRKQVIRYWGLYSGRRLASRNEARIILGQALEESDDEFLDWQGCLEKIGVKDQGCCKVCHEPLKVVMDLPRPRSRDP